MHCSARRGRIKAKDLILLAVLALSLWALWPPASADRGHTLGSAPAEENAARAARAGVKYTIRFNPGPMYLPGVVPENTSRPIEGIANVGRAFERLFPDTRIEFVGVPGDVREWLVTQLSSGQAPDVIQINVEDVWQDVHKNWYLPLDDYFARPNPFIAPGQPGAQRWFDVFKYPIPTRGTTAPNGRMYCVVLDMIETGIFYNKTVFDRLGLSAPRDWNEFLAIQAALKQAGYTPLLIERACLADWGIDLLFEQLYGDMRDLLDLDYDPRRGEYLHGYLDWDELIFLHRQGFFGPDDPRWRELWRILKEWRPYMSQELNPQGVNLIKNFVTQEGAMFWSTSQLVRRLLSDPDIAFDWDIFYLPPIPSSYSPYARGTPMCVIGGSAMQYTVTNTAYGDTRDPATSERLKRVIAFLQFLTTPQNCDRVVNEQVALIPNIKGVEPHPELRKFDEILQRHYAMTKWYYTFGNQWNQVLIRMVELHMNDGIDRARLMQVLEQDLERATRSITKRKALDSSRHQKAWDERKAMRRTFADLPEEAR